MRSGEGLGGEVEGKGGYAPNFISLIHQWPKVEKGQRRNGPTVKWTTSIYKQRYTRVNSAQ